MIELRIPAHKQPITATTPIIAAATAPQLNEISEAALEEPRWKLLVGEPRVVTSAPQLKGKTATRAGAAVEGTPILCGEMLGSRYSTFCFVWLSVVLYNWTATSASDQ